MSNQPRHILLTGGTGAVGKCLTNLLLEKGYQVSHLSRKQGTDPRIKTFLWDVPKGQIDDHCIDGVDVIIHLAGAGIADKRWTDERKKELTDSRAQSVKLIYDLLRKKPNKVTRVISAAAIGYYGDRADEILTEQSAPGQGFMPECCIAWEKAVDDGRALGLNLVKFRTGVVLDKNEGALPQMAKPIKFFAGAPLGTGKQWVPWIHWTDVAGMYLFALEHEQLQGVFNMAAPNPATNQQLMGAIARQLHRPLWPIKVPVFIFKMLMGEMSTLVLGSTRVSSQKIVEAGYQFQYPDLAKALKDIYG
jgi:hypothetical protein